MWNSSQLPATRNNRQLRKYVLAGGAVAVVGTLAYQAYQSDAYGRSKRYVTRLREALQQYADALATGGEICSTILRDLQQFLHSENSEVPPSLRQVSKLLQSQEFTSTASSTVAALYQGLAGPSTQQQQEEQHGAPQPSTVDKILDALLSDRGHSLVSVAVSMGAKNMVSAYVEASARAAQEDGQTTANQPDASDKLFSFLSTPEGQQLAVMAVAAFASNGMRVYMDKSLEVNLYEDMFSSMAKPHHLEAVKQCIGVFARDVVATYLHGGNISRAASANALQNNHEELPQLQNAGQVAETGTASAAVSLAGDRSPAESNSSPAAAGATTSRDGVGMVENRHIEALKSRQLVDDLDSDSLLHERRKKNAAAGQSSKSCDSSSGKGELIAAVGKEWLNVSKDPDGRQAIAAVVGTATREMVTGVSTVMVERFSTVILLMVTGDWDTDSNDCAAAGWDSRWLIAMNDGFVLRYM